MAIFEETFTSGTSFIHRLDPRVRLACSGILTIPAAFYSYSIQALTLLFLAILLVLFARLPLKHVLNRLIVVNTFILFLWLFIPFSTPGEVIYQFHSLALTQEGITLSVLITLKSNAIVLTLLSLLGSIKIQDLGPALQQLKVPSKICYILLFTYRYIFLIHQEYTTMRLAMTARGFNPKSNTRTYKTYAWVVGMLLVKSWDRAERVFSAMKCRGFRGRFYSLTRFSTRYTDYIFVLACLICSLLIQRTSLFSKGLL